MPLSMKNVRVLLSNCVYIESLFQFKTKIPHTQEINIQLFITAFIQHIYTLLSLMHLWNSLKRALLQETEVSKLMASQSEALFRISQCVLKSQTLRLCQTCDWLPLLPPLYIDQVATKICVQENTHKCHTVQEVLECLSRVSDIPKNGCAAVAVFLKHLRDAQRMAEEAEFRETQFRARRDRLRIKEAHAAIMANKKKQRRN